MKQVAYVLKIRSQLYPVLHVLKAIGVIKSMNKQQYTLCILALLALNQQISSMLNLEMKLVFNANQVSFVKEQM